VLLFGRWGSGASSPPLALLPFSSSASHYSTVGMVPFSSSGSASASRNSDTPIGFLVCRHPYCILNHMAQYRQTHFDASFGALSDATRRGVLEQLGRADASITALAERFHMTLTGMKKHVGVLEQAGLVSTEKVGRVRTCKLGLRGLEEEAAWIERYRQLWAARFDELDIVVEELKRKEKANGRKKRK
jgi:DNA-binding transcriptional ArsR family regulator